MYRRTLLLTLFAIAQATSAFADAPAVTAVLSNSEAAVGQMVQLAIKVTGASNVEAPEDIASDGLEIHRTGTSRQFEMRNFASTSSLTYTYTVFPLKAGTFKIPSQTIRAGGASLRTPELTLHVSGRPSQQQAAPNSGSNANIDTSKLVTAELIVPKKAAYVGEMIPVVVRVTAMARLVALEPPTISGQGFTMQKLQSAEQPQIAIVNGRQCEVYTFKTAIAAVRPGKLEIGPVKANARVIVPATRQRSSRSRSPFDIFNMDDPFSDPFFSDPLGRGGERREVPVASDPMVLEVKPLPPNPPANFAGAVGTFSMTVEANPKSVQTGDPITVTSTIAGRGNFDRLTAPALEDEHGWHKYPPTSKFKQDDDVGISGSKTFEMVLSPNEKKQAISPFVFSFFDPVKENYVTLRNEAIPIRVEGSPVAASPSPVAAAAAPAPSARSTSSPPADAAAKPPDILYQLTDRPAHSQSFTPLYLRPTFWLAQLLPLLALIGFIIWKMRTMRAGDRAAQRTAQLQQEATELMRRLRRGDAPPQEYFSQASRAVQLKTALAQDRDPNGVDAEAAAAAFHLDESASAQLRRLFERADEMRYSGARNGEASPESRREALELVESLRT
ncbi:MAG: BatD family protein [Spartobacteria bacterium]